MGEKATKSRKTSKKPDFFEEIRKDLLKQRFELLSQAGAVINNQVRIDSCPDMTDQASAEVDQAFILKLKEREQKLLNKIDETLERMKVGTYGICRRCEANIPYPRLKVRPVTDLCIECKTKEEEEEKIRK